MNNKQLGIYFLVFFMSVCIHAQNKFTLKGTITDASTNETLIGATIIITELQTGTTTNEYGFFSITLPEGNYNVQASYIGYSTIVKTIELTESITLNLALTEEAQSLD